MSRLTGGPDISNCQPSTISPHLAFRSSIEALVRFAVMQAEAEAGILYIHDPVEALVLTVRRPSTGTHVRGWDHGAVWGCASMPDRAHTSDNANSIQIAWRVSLGDRHPGTLVLRFQEPLEDPAKLATIVEQIADSLACVLILRDIEREAAALAVRASRLEAALADSKIAERVSGCARGVTTSTRSPIDAITSHVANVLSASHLRDELSDRVRRLEQELHKRDLLNEAKALLQQTRGLSESEAYMQLRNASRRTRRPLVDIAQAVIAHEFRELHEMSA